jgi:hypothetical protein
MRILDGVVWASLMLLGFAIHGLLDLPGWALPVFALPAFVYAWRRHAFPGRRLAVCAALFVLVGMSFFVADLIAPRLEQAGLNFMLCFVPPLVVMLLLASRRGENGFGDEVQPRP